MKDLRMMLTGREVSKAENKKGLSQAKAITLGNGSRTAREWLENGSTKFLQCFEYCLGLSRLRLNNGSTMARVWKYAAMLLMVLTLGVGEMWADSTVKGGHIYFDEYNSGYTGAGDMQFWVGHNSYSCAYSMTKITNTKLWHYEAPSWGDATYFAFTSGASGWDCASQKYYDRIGSSTWKSGTKESYTIESGKFFVFKVASTANKAAVNSDSPYGYQGYSYSSLNKSQTINVKVSTDGGTTYNTPSTSPATISFSSKTFSNASTCGTSSTGNFSGSTKTMSKDAGYTATTEVSYSSMSSDYTFVCWHDGSSSVGTGTSYTYYPTSTNTITARFTKNFTVGDKIYLLRNSTWKNASGLNHYAAYFYGAGGNTWVNCTRVGTSDYYYVEVPSGNWGYVIFVALNKSANSFDNKIYQTDDLMYDASHNGVEITGGNNSQSRITVYTGLTVSRNNSSYAAAPSISNGQTVVKSGSAVTVNAGNATTGYHWVNWTTSNGSFGTATNKTTTFTPNANSANAQANYAINTQTVTFNKNGGSGTTMSNQVFTYGVAQTLTSNSYTAPTGYYFGGWATSSERAAAGTVDHANGASITLSPATHGTTYPLYAVWLPKQSALTLDKQTGVTGYGGNAGTVSTSPGSATYGAAMPTLSGTMPTAAPGYAFMGFYDATDGGGTKYYNADGSSAHNWDKNTTDGTTLYAYYQKAEISSLTHEATVAKADVAYLVVNPVLNVTPVGYTAICWTLHYAENDNEVATSGASYYAVAAYTEGGTKPRQVRFTLNNMSVGSYYVQAVLKASASSGFDPCSTGTTLDTETGSFSVVGSSKVTIQYKDLSSGNVIASSSSVEIEAGGNADVEAPSIIGYTFNSWSVGAGVTKNSEDGNTINISSPYDGVITAFYTKKRVIYFNNTLGWDTVCVYFYKNDSYWGVDSNEGKGTGANTGYTFTNTPYSEGKHGGMQRVAPGSNIWYFDAEGAGVNASYTNVVFADKEQHGYNWFHEANVVRRSDYKSTTLPMYVPLVGDPTPMNNDKTNYYFEGYWMNYPDNTGYTLYIFNTNAANGVSHTEIKHIPFSFTADKAMPMSVTTDLEAGHTYGFKIKRADESWYGNTGTMSNGHSGDGAQTAWEFKSQDVVPNDCGLTTSGAGNYTFTLNYGLDASSNYNYLVGVRYPESTGDFRVQYKDNVNSTWKTSVVIPAVTEADTISYFVRKASTPYIRVQKCTATYGGGKTTVTWNNENSGSNIISSLPTAITENGVYNFIFKKVDGALVLDKVEPYTGNFYIRVDGAGSTNWDNYRAADHLMPFSEYSFNQTTDPYSHYYTQWYAAESESKNIKFVVANDYSTNISDTITRDGIADSYVDALGALSGRNANIRFMYNYKTNVATRRYIDGAQEDDSEFLLLIPSNNTSIYDAATEGNAYTQVKFSDNGNWVYEANVYVVPGTTYKLKSQFGVEPNIITQYFKGAASGAGEYETLIGGSGARLQIRLIYDFKTNRLVTGYVPSGTIDTNIELNADIMFVREHQGNVTQITFGEDKSITEIKNVYTTLKFNKSTITNPGLSRYERDLYYISFPYDVLVSDIIGFGTYGTHWIIEYYDGAGRAEKGFWADSKSFWKFVTPAMKSTYKLNAGTGYIVALDLDEMESTDPVWEHTETVELIFPGNISSISDQEVTYNMPSHQCNIGPRFEGGDDRRIKDSHWNVLGVPAYHNTTGSFANHTDEIGETSQVWSASNAPNYLYTWNMTDNSLSVTNASGYEYKAMHAYMVQYYGDVTFHTSTNAAPASVAARTYAEAPSEVQFRLEIQQNEVAVDQTFVTMSNDGEVSREFVFGEDMSKEFNKNKANIYTIVTSTIEGDATVTEVAGNTLPMSEQTTLVPVGVKVVENADYTFSIPDGTEGVGVTLIDKVADTYTNLSGLDYTVSLEAGTYDDRFVLQISPIQHVVTEQSAVSSQQSAVRKVLIDGLLYIVRDGKMFDARGARVE